MKKRVLSGMRATGRLHLGNYLGAAKGYLELSQREDYDTFFMVADAHAVTTPFDPKELSDSRIGVIIDYLSVGLDPERSTLFIQSMVPEHFELLHYFSSVVSIARMQHLPTFKDKVKQYPDSASMALLNYPILMAADILAYKAAEVPVGVDQEPHLEVAREIARKMNEAYGLDFPEPVAFRTASPYVPSLLGEGKMSKSVEGSAIGLTDSLEIIEKKLARVPTDSGKGEIRQKGNVLGDDEKNDVGKRLLNADYLNEFGAPMEGVKALFEFVELFEGEEKRKKYEEAYTSTGVRYGDLKKELAQAIFGTLEPIQEKRLSLESNMDFVQEVIAEGARKARLVAGQTLTEVKQKMGLQ